MALGQEDNNKKKYYDPVVYSGYKMSNLEGVDPSSLGVTFFNQLLKLSISPLKKDNGDKIAFDHENGINIYITHTKARMLANEISAVLASKGAISNGGVNSGSDGLIVFSDGKELGIDHPCLIIIKIDENGKVKSSYAYEFKTNFHYSIRNFDTTSSNFDKVFYDNLEVEQFVTLLEEYYTAMTGAVAYSVIDNMKYDNSRLSTKVESIQEKLGISLDKPSYSKKSSGNSYFNNNSSSNNSSSSRKSTMDDLYNEIED